MGTNMPRHGMQVMVLQRYLLSCERFQGMQTSLMKLPKKDDPDHKEYSRNEYRHG